MLIIGKAVLEGGLVYERSQNISLYFTVNLKLLAKNCLFKKNMIDILPHLQEAHLPYSLGEKNLISTVQIDVEKTSICYHYLKMTYCITIFESGCFFIFFCYKFTPMNISVYFFLLCSQCEHHKLQKKGNKWLNLIRSIASRSVLSDIWAIFIVHAKTLNCLKFRHFCLDVYLSSSNHYIKM